MYPFGYDMSTVFQLSSGGALCESFGAAHTEGINALSAPAFGLQPDARQLEKCLYVKGRRHGHKPGKRESH